MAGYWPSSLVAFYKDGKRERGQYPATLIELAWSIKYIYYMAFHAFMSLCVFICVFAGLRKNVLLKLIHILFSLFSFSLTLSVFSFSYSIPTEKSQKISLLSRKIFCERKP